MRRCTLLVFLFLPTSTWPQDKEKFVMEPGPKSPEESLACMKPRPGFKVELMACEPAVMDPIAFAFGPDGKLWVVEMGDYPLGVDGKDKKGGRVKFLEKTRPDGRYDKATVFLDNLGYPTGVFPWRKGILITCAPDILYVEDTDNDGKADKVEKLYTGFREGNQQHRVNGLTWGLDNWIHGANGDSGGMVKSKTAGPVNISGRDFRIRPDTGNIETTSGQAQFGRNRDDWGNWFGNNNSNPMFHYVLEDRYLRRNPTLLFTDVKVAVPEKPGAAPVFPISKPLPRFNTPGAVNHFTSACSTMIYRDDLFGPEFEGNSFVAEPVHNLVHREIMHAKGVTFTSKRADDEQKSEFLASSDNWFRPAMIQVGPDGALWIADMYRYVIEHPEWIPKEWQAKLDLRAGHDKGRIYRVYPEGKKPRAIPNLADLDAKGLVAALDSPSGWQRDMAQMLLVTRNEREATSLLEQMAFKHKRPQARLHALMTLSGLGRLTSDLLLSRIMEDEHPGVRKNAILCSETIRSNEVKRAWLLRTKDSDPTVLLQLACSLGEQSGISVVDTLFRLAEAKGASDRHIQAALASSVNDDIYDELMFYTRVNEKVIPPALAQQLIRYGIARGKRLPPTLFGATLTDKITSENLIALAAVCDSVEAGKSSFAKLGKTNPETWKVLKLLERVFDHARKLTLDEKMPLAERLLAVRVLGRGPNLIDEDVRLMEGLLVPATADELQAVTLNHLAKVGDAKTAETLIKKWKHLSPGLRGQAFDALTARGDWTKLVLSGLETKKLLAAEIDAARRDRLLNHRDKEIKDRAAKLFAASSSKDRDKIIADYAPALSIAGDAKKGSKHFARVCAACHKLGDLGQDVGPPLASVGDRTPAGLLNAILDPNRAVEPRYLNYVATTQAGVSVSGILAAETSTSITLVAVDGKKHDILRADLEDLTCNGKSAMPEGLEKDLSVKEMADLLAYLTSYLPPKPAEEVKTLLKEFQEAAHAHFKATTDEERAKAVARIDKLPLRILELVEENPKDPIALEALVQVVTQEYWLNFNSSHPGFGKESRQARAIALLLRDHLKSDKLSEACKRVHFGFRQECETFLRTVLALNPHQEVQGHASLRLAQFLMNRLHRLDLLKEQPEIARRFEGIFGKDYLEALAAQDRAKVIREAEALFEQTIEKYGDVKMPYGGTVGDQAKRELFEIRHLAVGKEAQDIESPDQDGKPFKLSDYRGKVVLLYFWSEY